MILTNSFSFSFLLTNITLVSITTSIYTSTLYIQPYIYNYKIICKEKYSHIFQNIHSSFKFWQV